MRLLPLPVLVLILALTLVSCRKEQDTEPLDRDYTSAIDNNLAEIFFSDALKQSDAAAKDNELPCNAEVTIDLAASPRTMLIDFGTTNCIGSDGWVRRGRLFVTFTGPYGEPGTVITIVPQDYFVNDHGLQGQKTVTNMGMNAQDQTYFTVVMNGTVTAPDGSWTSTHSAQRVRTWVEGEGTLNPFDDVYLIGGNGSGVNRNGIPYTLLITTPLRAEVGCRWITAGVLQITPGSLAIRTVNFGNGACDNQVTVAVNGFSFTFGG
ncbi:MAG: hypothetical protein WEC15_06500 [Flavobacteriales bacterium]